MELYARDVGRLPDLRLAACDGRARISDLLETWRTPSKRLIPPRDLSEVVDTLEREHGRVVVTKHGRPAVVMLSIEDLESLEETLAILSNPALLDSIRDGQTDVAAGRTEWLSREEALARVAKR